MAGSLRAGLCIDAPLSAFDPQRIHSLVDAHLARNIYSRLISLDDNGNIKAELAKDFLWDGKSFVVNLRPDLRTSTGEALDEQDVLISLIRLIRFEGATHGNLRTWLCPDYDESKPLVCSGIAVSRGKLILTPTKAQPQFFLPLFASTDFSIIPRGSIDLKDPKWPITGFRNTSGVYSVERSSENGAMTWVLNKNHPFADDRMYRVIDIVPVPPAAEGLKAYTSGAVDFLPTSTGLQIADLKNLDSSTVVHQTHPIRLVQMGFTESGRRALSSDQRLFLGKLIKSASQQRLNRENGQDVDQIFPMDSDGGLSKSQIGEYTNVLSAAKSKLHKKVKLGILNSLSRDLGPALAKIQDIEVVSVPNFSAIRDPANQFDAYIVSGDTSFYESISMIHYYFSMGVFGDYQDGLKWLSKYMQIEDKARRLEALRDLHLCLLKEGVVVPLYGTPYIAIGRRPMKMEISKFFAGTPMWSVFYQ